MLRVSDLRHKDIVNIMDGRRLGFIRDVDVDVQAGRIRAVIVPGEAGLFSLFTHADDMVIPWAQIRRIGVDVILVELERAAPTRRFSRRREREEVEEAMEAVEIVERAEKPYSFSLPAGAAAPLDYERDMEDLLKKQL